MAQIMRSNIARIAPARHYETNHTRRPPIDYIYRELVDFVPKIRIYIRDWMLFYDWLLYTTNSHTHTHTHARVKLHIYNFRTFAFVCIMYSTYISNYTYILVHTYIMYFHQHFIYTFTVNNHCYYCIYVYTINKL